MRFYEIINENRKFLSPKFLYHCTPASKIDSIKQNGLDPNFGRRNKSVYLAIDKNHAMGYDDHHGQNGDSLLLKIDVSQLNKNLLKPDDMDLPDMLNDPDGELDDDEDGADGPWWKYSWQKSLSICGQCAYEGIIPISAIKIVEIIKENRETKRPTTRVEADAFYLYNKLTENNEKITLKDIYDDRELYDHSEAIGLMVDNYGDGLLSEKFTVREMSPEEARKLKSFGDKNIMSAFKKSASKNQKEIVNYKKSHFDPSRIIVISRDRVVDGHHHLIAAIQLNQPIKYIDLEEEPLKESINEKSAHYVFHGTTMERWKKEKTGTTTLYVSPDPSAASRYAKDFRTKNDVPILVKFNVADLARNNTIKMVEGSNGEAYEVTGDIEKIKPLGEIISL